MPTLNLGIVAHVDAGKTSLTERLLFDAGALDHVGSVDGGDTHTDTLALERARGITIKAAVATFRVDGALVNLIDTPGHPDFIAEVERSLAVLDGVVVVISAVEGVQPQTRVLMRAVRRLGLPAVLFVNKIDRRGARTDELVDEIRTRLGVDAVAMQCVEDAGTRSATVRSDAALHGRLVESLTAHDDGLLAAFVRDGDVDRQRLDAALTAQTRRALVHPVFFGSAITGAGAKELAVHLVRLLPTDAGDPAAPLSASVFKIDTGRHGERVAFVRMFDGVLHVRDRVAVRGAERKVSAVSVFEPGGPVEHPEVAAGRIATVRGLDGVRIGDALGASHVLREANFAPPTLETVVEPVDDRDRGRLHAGLSTIAEQDPLIGLRQDDVRNEVAVSLYGEVQKEVIGATLAAEYGVDVRFRPTTTICVERVVGSGTDVEVIDTPTNPYLATVGLRVDPAPRGSGITCALEVELGSMPYAFMRAIEDTVQLTLAQGLRGWQVIDARVTLVRNGYWPRQSHMHQSFDKTMSSTAGDFRMLTPLVLMTALRRAGTQVLEPLHRFTLELPASSYGAVVPVLGRLRAVPLPPTVAGDGYLMTGTIPAASVHALRQELPGLTGGGGVLETEFDDYQPAPAPVPERERTDADPLDRAGYLQRVRR